MRLATIINAALILWVLVGSLAGQQGVWTPVTTVGAPPAHISFGFDSDPQSEFFVLFGGLDGGGAFYDETWVFDGNQTWTQAAPLSKPSARTADLVFDPGRNVFVLHGGQGAGTGVVAFGDTWEFDGSNWVQVTPSGPGPGARVNHASAYDAFESEVLVFGGLTGGLQILNDLWGFDGLTWTDRTPLVSPPPRQGSRLVYDAARDVHVLFGGLGGSLQAFNDTWEYSAATNTWTQVFTPTVPPGRIAPAMEYDASRGVIVMYGGGTILSDLDDTWEYDGSDWTQIVPPSAPPARRTQRFAPTANGLVLYGGNPGAGETWIYSGLPAPFPGSGGDCAVLLGKNGGPPVITQTALTVLGSDTITLNCQSPLGALDFAGFALVGSTYPQGTPPAGLTLFGPGPADVWIDPANAFVVVDGLGAPTSVFVPQLVPGGLTLGPFTIPVGLSGQALNLQIFAADPMANPVGISTSDAATLTFM